MYLGIALPPRTNRWTVSGPSPCLGQVLLNSVRQMLHGHRLQPYTAGTGQRGEEQAAAAEERVLDARDGGDVELHRLLVHADMARMHAQGVAGLQVVSHDLAVELDPGRPLALQSLHAKTGAAEYARTQPLLEADRELDANRRAHEAVAVNHVALAWRDLHRQDLPRQLGREGEQPGTADRRVLGYEQSATGD